MNIQPVVEGYGDVQAIPHLIRRMLHERSIYDVRISHPFRAGDFWKVRRAFPTLIRQLSKEASATIVLLDNDDGCAIVKREELAQLIPKDLDTHCELAFLTKEFETLFLADPDTSKRVLGIPDNVEFPSNPEEVRDAKGWLSRHMPQGFGYKETVHQEQLSSQVVLETLRQRSPSFRHLNRCIDRLVANI